MDLINFIKERGLISDSVLAEISNNNVVKKFTFFQELYANGKKYGVAEEDLLKWAVSAGGPGYELLESTRDLSTEHEDYNKLGGVERCLDLKCMLVRRKRKALCVVTQRPDDPGLIVVLNKAFGAGSYSVGICGMFLWKAIYQSDVEPLFIEAKAQTLSTKTTGSRRTEDKQIESEARSIYKHILQLGVTSGASDIHLIPRVGRCDVLYRIDGTNYKRMSVPNDIAGRVANLLTIDGKVPNKGPDTPQDGKIKYHPEGAPENETRDLRFSILPATYGKDLNIRFLNNKLYTFAELGMSPDNVATYSHILDMPQGLIMQVGPTGSGKSTTLYAGLHYIHENSLRNIITVEDPVEVFMEGITQVTTNDEAGLTFARVARQFLRHDVDVGVIGEIRDEETALEAVRAATTGHLVISSLHTNDSLGVLERLTKLGVDSYTLSEVLVAVMGQRLVRRLCPDCKERYTIMSDDSSLKGFNLPGPARELELYRAVGCEHCNNIGYKGRIAVNEILVVDRVLRDLIQRHVTRKEMEDHLSTVNFKTMFMDAQEKVLSGVTSLDELKPMMADTLAFK